MAASTSAIAANDEVARCPALLGPATPEGARRFGEITPSLRLTAGTLAMAHPADFDPEEGNLEEEQADETEGETYLEAATYSMFADMTPMSMICRYGRDSGPMQGQAMLLIPLKPQSDECRFIAAKGARAASMICRGPR